MRSKSSFSDPRRRIAEADRPLNDARPVLRAAQLDIFTYQTTASAPLSTKQQDCAPRLSASRPIAPVPANRSSTLRTRNFSGNHVKDRFPNAVDGRANPVVLWGMEPPSPKSARNDSHLRLQPAAAQQDFRDLNSVGGGSFTDIVRNHPHGQAVFNRRIRANSANKGLVCSRSAQRDRIACR